MSANGAADDGLDSLPPSCKLVYKTLEYAATDGDGWLTLQEIEAETRLSRSTAKYAIARLKDAGEIESRCSPRSPRADEYKICPNADL